MHLEFNSSNIGIVGNFKLQAIWRLVKIVSKSKRLDTDGFADRVDLLVLKRFVKSLFAFCFQCGGARGFAKDSSPDIYFSEICAINFVVPKVQFS